MYSQESFNVMAASYAAMNDREDWSRIGSSFLRSFTYRWVAGRIVHPLSVEESRARRRIMDQYYRFMGWHYHHVFIASESCLACYYECDEHTNPFPSIER